MHKVGEVESSHKQKYTIEEVMAEIYDDSDIQIFLKKYEDYLDDDIIATGKTTLMEFVRMKDDIHVKPDLFLYNSQIAIQYYIRDTPLQQKYRDKVPSRLFYDASTKKYKGASLRDYQMDVHNSNAYGIALSFVDKYRYGDKSKGIWLCGKFGIGKTYLMGVMATELNKRKVGVNFVNAAQLMNDMYEIIRSNSKDNSVQKQIGYLQRAEVLVIDDIGTEKITHNNVVDVIYAILKYRGEHNKPTFITSNFTKDQYFKLLMQSNAVEPMEIARLKEQLDVLTKEVQMVGNNWRNKA